MSNNNLEIIAGVEWVKVQFHIDGSLYNTPVLVRSDRVDKGWTYDDDVDIAFGGVHSSDAELAGLAKCSGCPVCKPGNSVSSYHVA